jgi:hypothetical protein
VGGDVVASRGGGFFTRLIGGGFPDEAETVAAVRARLGQKVAAEPQRFPSTRS